MKTRRIRSFFAPAGSALLVLLLIGWHSRKEDKLLIFLKNTTNQQATTLTASTLMALVTQNGIAADTTTNSAYISEDSLKNYRAVIFLQTSPDVLDTWQQNDIERFVQAGGGMGVINAGGFTTYQWPWYNGMLAGGNTPADANKPVFWTKPYDGGLVFYAAAGNVSDQTLAKQVMDGIKQSMDGPALNYQNIHTARTPEENRFTSTVLDSYMEEPIEMEVMDDGRVLFIERRGNVKLYDPTAKATKVINKLSVQLTGNYEDGLLGLELDPKFEKNHFVYLYYSPLAASQFRICRGLCLLATVCRWRRRR